MSEFTEGTEPVGTQGNSGNSFHGHPRPTRSIRLHRDGLELLRRFRAPPARARRPPQPQPPKRFRFPDQPEGEAGAGGIVFAVPSLSRSTFKMGAFDQFAENKEKFGVKSDFDISLYSTRVEYDEVPLYCCCRGLTPRELRRVAASMEKEMRATGSTNLHVLEERGMEVNLNDEDLYSRVGVEAAKKKDRARDRNTGEKVLSRSIMKKVEAPQNAPKTVPKTTPKTVPKSAPNAVPNIVPNVTPNVTPKSPKTGEAKMPQPKEEKKETSGAPTF